MLETKTQFNVPGIIAACLVIVMQIVLAPAMTIGQAMPNFIAAYVLCAALCHSSSHPVILAFVLGMVFDLIGSGPVGAMAFCLLLVSTLASLVYSYLSNTSFFTAIIVIALSCLIIELLYGIIMLICGMADGFGSALLYRILPCALYDFVIAAIMFPIVSRLLSQQKTSSSPSTMSLMR